MRKRILITGATSGIGLEVARRLVVSGHHVLLHGRNPDRLDASVRTLSAASRGGCVERYAADLSSVREVIALAEMIAADHGSLDVLVNNANVYCARDEITEDGLDVRFAVNAIAPWLLTRHLSPRMGASGRVVNLCTAAQSPVEPKALTGEVRLADGAAYAQSKLALMMWSRALSLDGDGPLILVVDPGAVLMRNMMQGPDVTDDDPHAGAGILVRAALEDDFATASDQFPDPDAGRFAVPHPDALDVRKSMRIVRLIEAVTRSADPSRASAGRRPTRARATSSA